MLVPVSGAGSRRRVRCDLVAVSTGRQPSAELAWMAGAGSRYDEEHAEMRVVDLPAGVFLAGRAAGLEGPPEAEEEHGRRAGRSAAAHALGADPATAGKAPEAAAHPLAADPAMPGNAPGVHPQAAAAAHAQGAGTAEAGQAPEAVPARPLAADPADIPSAPGDHPQGRRRPERPPAPRRWSALPPAAAASASSACART